MFALFTCAPPGCGGGDDGGAVRGDAPPIARVRVPAFASAGATVGVNALASGGAIERYRFEFGDGSRAIAGASGYVLHRFRAAGHYTVRVTASGPGGSDSAQHEVEVAAEPGPIPRFDLPSDRARPSWGEIPWPSDLDRDDAGKVAIDGVNVANAVAKRVLETGLDSLHGFGTSAAAYVWIDGDLDPTALPTTPDETVALGSPIVLVVADPDSPHYRERAPVVVGWDAADRRLSILPVPGVPLRPKTRYALVVRTDAWGERGGGPTASLTAPATLAALLAGETPAVPCGAKARALTDTLASALADAPDFPDGDLSGIAAATVFTTQPIADDLLAIRNAFDSGDPAIPAPAPRFDAQFVFGAGGRATLDALLGPQPDDKPGLEPRAHQHVATIVTRAWFRAPRYLSPDAHFLDAHGGTFVVADGAPQVQGVWEIPFSLVLPIAPPGPAGYPVVIAQHGLGAERSQELLLVANALAAEGFAVASIDAIQHGDRLDLTSIAPETFAVLGPVFRSLGFDIAPRAVDERPNYPASTLVGPDGWADDGDSDGARIGLIDALVNLAGFRDNLRQNVVDHIAFARMLREFDAEIPGVGRVRFDPANLYYSGTSLGGVLGANFVAFEPTLRAANLHSAGGALGVNLLIHSPGIGGLVEPLLTVVFGARPEALRDDFSPLVNLAQTVLDAGDPINVARHAIREPLAGASGPSRPRSVLMLEAMWDWLIPNSSTEALARSFGLALLEPSYRDVPGVPAGGPRIEGNVNAVTGALAQYSPAEHGTIYTSWQGRISYEIGFPFASGERFRPLAHDFTVRQPVEAAMDQVRDFFLTARDGGPGIVEMKRGYAPRHDYDDDGFLDDDETAAGTDPNDPTSHP
ncbi:MAG: PKD domain-containing protein [bacterium]